MHFLIKKKNLFITNYNSKQINNTPSSKRDYKLTEVDIVVLIKIFFCESSPSVLFKLVVPITFHTRS